MTEENTGRMALPWWGDLYHLRRINRPARRQRDSERPTKRRGGGQHQESHKWFIESAKQLPRTLPVALRRGYLEKVIESARRCKGLELSPVGVTKRQIQAVERQARELLKAFKGLNRDAALLLESTGYEVAIAATRPDRTPDEAAALVKIGGVSRNTCETYIDHTPPVLALWQIIQDIENVAHITAALIAPKRGKKPLHSAIKAFVTEASNLYRDMTGKAPPKTEQGWFCVWVSEVGTACGLEFGPRLAASALRNR